MNANGVIVVVTVIGAMIGSMAFGVREWLGTFPEIWGAPVAFEYVAYRVLLTALAMLAIVMGAALAGCYAVLTNCPLLAAPH